MPGYRAPRLVELSSLVLRWGNWASKIWRFEWEIIGNCRNISINAGFNRKVIDHHISMEVWIGKSSINGHFSMGQSCKNMELFGKKWKIPGTTRVCKWEDHRTQFQYQRLYEKKHRWPPHLGEGEWCNHISQLGLRPSNNFAEGAVWVY